MNRIKELRKSKGISQETLGNMLGVQKAAISKYEVGRVNLPNEMLVALCDYFDVTADYLLGRNEMVEPLLKNMKSANDDGPFEAFENAVGVPLLGRVHAGLPMLASENIEEYIPMSRNDVASGEYFYMEVEGDCMEGAFIPEGALVLVKLQPDVENGTVSVIRIGDEVLLRKIKFNGSSVILIPANNKYEPMIVPAESVHVVGKVVEVRIRL